MNIKFDSKTKFNGVCTIIFEDDNAHIFDLVNESHVLYCSYKLKHKMDNRFRSQFILETPYNDSITIPPNEDSIRNAITYIMARESNKSDKELEMIVDYINHPEDFAVVDEGDEDEIS